MVGRGEVTTEGVCGIEGLFSRDNTKRKMNNQERDSKN